MERHPLHLLAVLLTATGGGPGGGGLEIASWQLWVRVLQREMTPTELRIAGTRPACRRLVACASSVPGSGPVALLAGSEPFQFRYPRPCLWQQLDCTARCRHLLAYSYIIHCVQTGSAWCRGRRRAGSMRSRGAPRRRSARSRTAPSSRPCA
jgi:hypothetical protein